MSRVTDFYVVRMQGKPLYLATDKKTKQCKEMDVPAYVNTWLPFP